VTDFPPKELRSKSRIEDATTNKSNLFQGDCQNPNYYPLKESLPENP